MSELRDLDLGRAGLDFVRSTLKGSGLCSYLARLPLQSGVAVAPLPPSVPYDRATKFESSLLGDEPIGKTPTVKRVHSLFAEFGGGTFIVQDVWEPSPKDAAAGMAESRTLWTQGEVYYVVSGEDVSVDAIRASMRDPVSFLLVAAFSRMTLPPRVSKAPEIVDESLIEALARQTVEIYISAYDQDGFVIWHRSG